MNTEMKHTPGMFGHPGLDHNPLHAAAPELLAALEAVLPIFDAFTQDELSITTIDEAIALLPQAKQAIAKAKGEAP